VTPMQSYEVILPYFFRNQEFPEEANTGNFQRVSEVILFLIAPEALVYHLHR